MIHLYKCKRRAISIFGLALATQTMAGCSGIVDNVKNAFVKPKNIPETQGTVTSEPRITEISPQSTDEDSASSPISFTIEGLEGTERSCTGTYLSYTSGNPSVVASTGAVTWDGTWPKCTAVIAPVANANGNSLITTTASVGSQSSASQTFMLTVNEVNDAPTEITGGDNSKNVAQTGPATILLGASTDPDLSTNAQTLSYVITTTPTYGTLGTLPAVVSTGTANLTYTPTLTLNGLDSFAYKVCDNATPQACTAVKNVFIQPILFTISVQVSGLTGTLVLQNSGGDELTISTNGRFDFPKLSDNGGSSSLTIKTQPSEQTCALYQNSASNLSSGVADVIVNCSEFWLLPQNSASYDSIGSNTVNGVFASGSTLYAATSMGLSISKDAGETWITKTTANGLGSINVNGVYAFGNNIYAATSNGLSISNNGGGTWANNTTANGLASNTVNGVYLSGDKIYAATSGGVSISTDGGLTWVNKTTAHGLGNNTVNAIYASGNNVYAATVNTVTPGGGLSMSSDGGATWVNISSMGGIAISAVFSVYAEGDTIYAGTNTRIAISRDAGTTWSTILFGFKVHGISASGNNIYAATAGGLRISTDGGTTWVLKTPTSGLGSKLIKGVFAAGGKIYAATIPGVMAEMYEQAGGLSISNDGGATWLTKTANGLGSSSIVGGVYAVGNKVYTAHRWISVNRVGGISISTDAGATWVNKTSNDGLITEDQKCVYAAGEKVYAAGDNGGLSFSADGGQIWQVMFSGFNGSVESVSTSGSSIYAATGEGLAISTDDFESYINKTTAAGLVSNTVNGVTTAGSIVYAATNGGLSISPDGGTTWVNKTTTDGLGSNAVNSVFIENNIIYAATNGGASISTDGGATWVNKTTANGLGTDAIKAIYAVGSNIYAATIVGLAVSSDGGATWVNKTTANGLGNNTVNGVHGSGNTIYIATENGLSVKNPTIQVK